MRDAIVVGAGLSGLVCARRLVDAGVDACVLEARPRIGGRLWSGAVAGTVVDLGGQWLSVDQPRLLALADELGVASTPQSRHGRAVLDDGRRSLFAQLVAGVAQWRAARAILRRARTIPADAPAAADDAPALDALAVDAWLAGAIANPIARARIAMHAELVLATDLAGLSVLAYLARLGTTGGFGPEGPDLPGGGRDHCFVGGAHQLAQRLADALGARVVIEAPVAAVERAPHGWTARVGEVSHAARQIVLALPPRHAAAIAPLPPALRALARSTQAGHVVKCFAAYDRAFWRDRGLSGEAYRPRGCVRAIIDATPPTSEVAILLGFVVGDDAAGWSVRNADERRRDVLDAFASIFGDAARAPRDYLEANWAAEPWSAGCVASTPPHALTADHAVWRGSFDGLHLAGTEASIRWPGYMEGAIEAGERAAAEVIARARSRGEAAG